MQQLIDNKYNITSWLPTSVKEMNSHGWDYIDVVLFTGDAYVDHPSLLKSMG